MSTIDTSKIEEMLEACKTGKLDQVQSLIQQQNNNTENIASLQDDKTGLSPLMMASKYGHLSICELLIREGGAPWNAIDRKGKCAGNYATENEHWDIVNFLVDEGTKAELILGSAIRLKMNSHSTHDDDECRMDDGQQHNNEGMETKKENTTPMIPVEHEPCTKPDYLQRTLRYNDNNSALLDDENDAVMMEWERPLMNAHASIITSNSQKGKVVLNVGFGMGIIDTALQELEPSLHVIIEAHPMVHDKMIKDGWDQKPNVRICFGKWQTWMPKLLEEGVLFDGIFFDTYGEHFTDLEDFQDFVSKTLSKPSGVYSFFNGLAPDNIFFHGVACQCVKLQLAKLGLDCEFAACEIKVDDKEWDGVRRKYFHNDTYYLPIATWKSTDQEADTELSETREKRIMNDAHDDSVSKKPKAM